MINPPIYPLIVKEKREEEPTCPSSPTHEDGKHPKDGDDEGDKGGFLGKVKGFIQDVGGKIEETVAFGKPTADVSAVHLVSMDLKHADIVADILVKNPNPIPIPLVDIKYLIESDDLNLLSGTIPDAGTIHAHGSDTIKVPLTLIYQEINSAYNDIEGLVIPYRVRVELVVDIPVIGRFTVPVERTGEVHVPYKPQVDLQKIRLDHFSFEETSAILHLKIDNKNDFDLGLNALEYEVWLADVRIGGATLKESAVIPGVGSGEVQIPISFRPKDFGAALWDLIRGKGAGYSMKGCIDVETPFGPMNLPFSKEGGSTLIKNADDSP